MRIVEILKAADELRRSQAFLGNERRTRHCYSLSSTKAVADAEQALRLAAMKPDDKIAFTQRPGWSDPGNRGELVCSIHSYQGNINPSEFTPGEWIASIMASGGTNLWTKRYFKSRDAAREACDEHLRIFEAASYGRD